MRRSLGVLLFIIAMQFSMGQGAYLGDALYSKISKCTDPDERFRVVMVMEDQVDFGALEDDWRFSGASLEERQRSAIREMQKLAQESQQELRSFLETFRKTGNGESGEIRTFWIVNMLAADIPLSLIWQLEGRPGIRLIELDSAWMSGIVAPYEMSGQDVRMPGASENGLKVIRADFMWKKGYTGKNRISYSIDTGVWSDHPALRDRFLANHFPMSQCWFPYDALLPADKSGSHGTHTLGTTLGLDPATSDTIGVAFNAWWICSDPVATSMATVKPLSDFMYAYEWALNPDGDTSTVWDIPDAINNSWGYGVAEDTLLCDSYVSQMFQAIEAAGIANVFSAGNEGPADTTISIPHHLNSNIVNSFTVGALDGNNPLYPIASFSSRGPSICGGSGSLLIKPEVSAPGVNVRSAILHDGYDYFSGTSMAGPHVTGAVVLLKEAFPFLPGSEILKALYFTATDLGIPGEDNTYGMGLINLEQAFLYLDSMYTAVPPDSNDYDAVLAEIIFPSSPYVCDSSFSPQVLLKNGASTAITQGRFIYRINQGPEQSWNWSGHIAAAQNLQISLPALSVSEEQNELLIRFVSDSLMGESSQINNSRVARFSYRPQTSIPFIEDFENGIDPWLWLTENPDFNLSWDTMAAGGLDFSTFSAVMKFNQALPAHQVDHLMTPSFDLSGADSVFLSFDVAYQNVHQVLSDTLKIAVSDNCGATFGNPVYKKGGQQLQTYDTLTTAFVPWRADQWRHETVDLSAYAGSSEVLIRFTGYNRRGNNLFIDNIKVYTGTEPASVGTLPQNQWTIGPNPAGEILCIYGESDHVILMISDLTGRLTFQEEIFNIRGRYELDLRPLKPGFYFLSIREGERTFSDKFIKTR